MVLADYAVDKDNAEKCWKGVVEEKFEY